MVTLASYIDALCAFAKLKVADHPLVDVAAMLPWKLSLLGDWELCTLIRTYQQLDPTRRLADFQRKLQKEVTRRKLTQKDVDESRHDYDECIDTVHVFITLLFGESAKSLRRAELPLF